MPLGLKSQSQAEMALWQLGLKTAPAVAHTRRLRSIPTYLFNFERVIAFRSWYAGGRVSSIQFFPITSFFLVS